jgi:hypothetical protein
MLLSGSARPSTNVSETQVLTRDAGRLITHKIWLPKALYKALPAFYIVSGILALLASIYISDWFWVVPHYLLFSAACIHMGLLIVRRRRSR